MSSESAFIRGVGCWLVSDFGFLLANVSHLVGVEDKFPNTGTFDLRFQEDKQRSSYNLVRQSSFLPITQILRIYHLDSDSQLHPHEEKKIATLHNSSTNLP